MVQRAEPLHFTDAPGQAPELTTKDLAWGIATGKFSASDPYVKESVVLLKQLFDSCATKNWSGITGLSGDGVGLPHFESGRAAMTFAVDFGYRTIAASAHSRSGACPSPRSPRRPRRCRSTSPRARVTPPAGQAA